MFFAWRCDIFTALHRRKTAVIKSAGCRCGNCGGYWCISEVDRQLRCGSGDFECGTGLSGTVRGGLASCKYRNDERMSAEYCAGSCLYSSMGSEYGSGRCRNGYIFVKLCGMYVFFCSSVRKAEKHLCLYPSWKIQFEKINCIGCMWCGDSGFHSESVKCNRYDDFK